LGAWCEFEEDYRTFRVDGISILEASNERYDEHERTLADYFAAAPEHDAVLGGVVDALKSGAKLWPTADALERC